MTTSEQLACILLCLFLIGMLADMYMQQKAKQEKRKAYRHYVEKLKKKRNG